MMSGTLIKSVYRWSRTDRWPSDTGQAIKSDGWGWKRTNGENSRELGLGKS